METLITITMNEKEYELYRTQKRLAADAHRDKDELQEKYEILARNICDVLRECPRGGVYILNQDKATMLLDFARKVLK